MMFDGSSGMKPSAEARRYVYRCLAAAVDNFATHRDYWLFGEITDESDRRRILKAARAVCVELERKGSL